MPATVLQQETEQLVEVRPGDWAAAAEVDGWLQEYAASGDPDLRERLIFAYLGLADRLAGRYRTSRGTTPEDLVQTARAALVAAVDRYDPAKGRAFVPFAVACVLGELKRSLRDTSWRVHVPRPLKEQAIRLCKAADELQQTLGRSATAAELADRLEVDQEEVLEALVVVTGRRELSLDQPVGDGTGGCLGSQIAAPDPREEPEDLLALTGLVAALPTQERTVVVLRFFGELDQDAIAAELGCSQMQVSRLLRRALARLRAQLVES